MRLWPRMMAGGGPRRTLGVWVGTGAGDVQRAGLDGEKLRVAVPASVASEVSVAAVPDAGVMLRRLSLPPAKAAVTDQLVHQQVAALLPGMDAQLAVAWRRDLQSGDVTVAAGSRGVLRSASGAEELQDCDLLVPAGLALDALLSRGMNPEDAPAAWAVDCGPVIWLLLYAQGGLVVADSLAAGPGPGESIEGVFADLLAGLTPEQRPAGLTWVGRDAAPSAEAEGAGLPQVVADDLPKHTGWSGTGAGADAGAWLAAGAALIGRHGRDAEGLDLEEAARRDRGLRDRRGHGSAPASTGRPPRRGPVGVVGSLGRGGALAAGRAGRMGLGRGVGRSEADRGG